MRFKTTIKLITDAKDKNEAMEIAGEYLSGHLTTGVDMRLHTAPVNSNMKRVGFVSAVLLIAALFTVHISSVKHPQNFIQNLPGDSVIQPPLKTSSADKSYSDFQKEWQARHVREYLKSSNK